MRIPAFLLAAACLCRAEMLSINLGNSPYIVDSVITVDSLVMEPGAALFFKSGSGLRVTRWLYSAGTSSAPVTLSSGEESPTPFDWNGIIIDTLAAAYIIHNDLSHCIDCIRSASREISVDSTRFNEVGQERMLLNDSAVASACDGYFCYNTAMWAAWRSQGVKKRNRTWPWIAGGVAGAGAAAVIYLLYPSEKAPAGDAKKENAIGYPNLPEE